MTKKILVWAAVFCLMMAGCEGFNPIGPLIQIGIFWYQGEAHKYYHSGQAEVATAMKASLKSLDLPVNSEKEDGDSVYIQAGGTSALGRESRFKIRIKKVKDETTKVSIRVNIFGDKPYAELIFRNLDKQPGIREFTSEAELQRQVR